MAGDLTVQIGVEFDPAGLAQIQQQINDLSKGDNKIKLTLDAKDIESQISNITKSLAEISKTPQKLKFEIDKGSIKDIQDIVKDLGNVAGKTSKGAQLGQGLNLNVGNLKSYKQELQQLADAFSKIQGKGSGAVETKNLKYDAINDAATAVLKYKDALGETHSVMMKMNEVSSGNGKWQVVGEQITQSFKAANKDIENVENKIKSINELLNNTKMQGFADQKQDLFNTDGVNDITARLEQLKAEYLEVGDMMKSGNFSGEELEVLRDRASQLDDQFKQLANSTKIYQDGFKNEQNLDSFIQKIENTRQALEKYKEQYDQMVAKDPSKADAGIEERFSSLQNALNNVDPSSINKVSAEVNQLGQTVTNAASQTQTLGQALTSSFGSVGQYLSRFVSAFYLINKGVQTVKSMINEVRSLDTSMTELSKVTNLSGDSMTQFVDNAYSMGKQVGRTGKDVIDATTTFSRAGYDLNESMELSKSALVMTNVGVDIPNMESAASDMISILKAYNVEASDSMRVIDKLYNVANKEPLDFGNITDMLVTAGGTLAQSGTSLEETMGLLTGGFATMRDTSVANG